MSKIAAKDVKLIPHRWAMHAVQALAQRDAELLSRVFTEIGDLPERSIDIQIQSFGCGAPLQFHDYGFFDAGADGYSTPLFERVVSGDTLLLLALRRNDPACAKVLIDCHASLEITNASNERPLEMLFDIFAAFQLHAQRQVESSNSSPLERTPTGQPFARHLNLQTEYEVLFERVRERLETLHKQIRTHVETELDRIYSQHAPERVAKIEVQMADFAFRELELLNGVRRKYDT